MLYTFIIKQQADGMATDKFIDRRLRQDEFCAVFKDNDILKWQP
ncbi:MAG: hypothetical protein PHY77_03655 [Desulfotomaculaceae bacterium]|nr:hypothetical protein [Desulfotomaculaceae bacterium]